MKTEARKQTDFNVTEIRKSFNTYLRWLIQPNLYFLNEVNPYLSADRKVRMKYENQKDLSKEI